MRNTQCRTWNMEDTLKNVKKCDIHTVGRGFYPEN